MSSSHSRWSRHKSHLSRKKQQDEASLRAFVRSQLRAVFEVSEELITAAIRDVRATPSSHCIAPGTEAIDIILCCLTPAGDRQWRQHNIVYGGQNAYCSVHGASLCKKSRTIWLNVEIKVQDAQAATNTNLQLRDVLSMIAVYANHRTLYKQHVDEAIDEVLQVEHARVAKLTT